MTEDIHVAYADDHKLVRKGIINIVQSLGGIIFDIEAESGRDLLKKLQNATNKPQVCILDINMPNMGGFETMKAIKAMWPEIKILILTIFYDEIHVIQMIKGGANGYILKNCDPEEIKIALQAICERGFYYSDIASNDFFQDILSKKIKLPKFTPNEVEVLKYSCSDLTYAQIGEKMSITHRSAEGYRDSLFRKLKVHTRSSLVLYAVKYGFVTVDIGLQPGLLK